MLGVWTDVSAQACASWTGIPFLPKYTTPFKVPPFDQIKLEHYKEAFLKGMEEQAQEINAIVKKT
jgi:peptidyl-dipeptidase Dcp